MTRAESPSRASQILMERGINVVRRESGRVTGFLEIRFQAPSPVMSPPQSSSIEQLIGETLPYTPLPRRYDIAAERFHDGYAERRGVMFMPWRNNPRVVAAIEKHLPRAVRFIASGQGEKDGTIPGIIPGVDFNKLGLNAAMVIRHLRYVEKRKILAICKALKMTRDELYVSAHCFGFVIDARTISGARSARKRVANRAAADAKPGARRVRTSKVPKGGPVNKRHRR